MPGPMGAMGTDGATGDTPTAVHIVPTTIVPYTDECGDFAEEGLGFGRARAPADWGGARRCCPQRCGREHGGADKTCLHAELQCLLLCPRLGSPGNATLSRSFRPASGAHQQCGEPQVEIVEP